MADRLSLQAKLESTLGSRNVYFQPPENLKISYPCIVYELARDKAKYADDGLYFLRKSYTVTVIDKNPDSVYPALIRAYPYCSFDRSFVSDGLNHFVFTIFY